MTSALVVWSSGRLAVGNLFGSLGTRNQTNRRPGDQGPGRLVVWLSGNSWGRLAPTTRQPGNQVHVGLWTIKAYLFRRAVHSRCPSNPSPITTATTTISIMTPNQSPGDTTSTIVTHITPAPIPIPPKTTAIATTSTTTTTTSTMTTTTTPT